MQSTIGDSCWEQDLPLDWQQQFPPDVVHLAVIIMYDGLRMAARLQLIMSVGALQVETAARQPLLQ